MVAKAQAIGDGRVARNFLQVLLRVDSPGQHKTVSRSALESDRCTLAENSCGKDDQKTLTETLKRRSSIRIEKESKR
jgi:hypothetical protein